MQMNSTTFFIIILTPLPGISKFKCLSKTDKKTRHHRTEPGNWCLCLISDEDRNRKCWCEMNTSAVWGSVSEVYLLEQAFSILGTWQLVDTNIIWFWSCQMETRCLRHKLTSELLLVIIKHQDSIKLHNVSSPLMWWDLSGSWGFCQTGGAIFTFLNLRQHLVRQTFEVFLLKINYTVLCTV